MLVLVDTEQLREAVRRHGYRDVRVDAHRPEIVTLVREDGSTMRAYLRLARSRTRYATERAALQLVEQHLQPPPVPRLLLALPDIGEGALLVDYLPGLNLADFIQPGVDTPPLPPTYRHREPARQEGLPQALMAAGQAVRCMHRIEAPHFGPLAGPLLNPHLHDARAYTRQEANHMLARAMKLGFLSQEETARIRSWLEARYPLIAPGERPALTHFDLHAGNLRVGAGDAGVFFQAIFDLELARGWLAEDDLALLAWYLRGIPGGWQAFCEGYGASVDLERLALFDIIKALTAVAYGKNDDWRDWCYRRVWQLLVGNRIE